MEKSSIYTITLRLLPLAIVTPRHNSSLQMYEAILREMNILTVFLKFLEHHRGHVWAALKKKKGNILKCIKVEKSKVMRLVNAKKCSIGKRDVCICLELWPTHCGASHPTHGLHLIIPCILNTMYICSKLKETLRSIF